MKKQKKIKYEYDNQLMITDDLLDKEVKDCVIFNYCEVCESTTEVIFSSATNCKLCKNCINQLVF
ncbi:hypothetical protein [Flavobacterium sp. HNIBRBA15423]|uniref:hypothetical protein n=1 Tax=Flavobacterium sp. HNIBRBA15423 TaxID=3458683 RepID=UPI0040445156